MRPPHSRLGWTLFTLLALGPGVARAEPDELLELRKQVQELSALVKAQTDRIEALERRQSAPLTPPPAATPPAPANAGAAAGEASAKPLPKSALGVEAYWKDGVFLRTPEESFVLRLGGRYQADGRFFTSDSRNTSTFLNRSARLFAQGWFHKDWEFKVEGDFVGGEPELQDGYLAWKHFEAATLKVGQFKEPFSMAQLDSPLFRKIAELAPIDRITPSRDLGVELSGKLFDSRVNYAIGFFNGNGRQNSGGTDNNDDKDVAARILVQPFRGRDSAWLKGIYVGGGGTWGNEEGTAGDLTTLESGTRWFDFHPSAGNAGTVRREGARSRWGVDLAWLIGPFGLRAEYLADQSDLERTNGPGALPADPLESTIDTSGYYVMANVWLTGEDDLYNKRPTVDRVFAPWSEKGGWGAIEVAVRYSTAEVDETAFDDGLADRLVSTGEINQWAGGVNWWFNPFVKLTVDYVHNHFEDGIVIDNRREKDESLIYSRFQVDF